MQHASAEAITPPPGPDTPSSYETSGQLESSREDANSALEHELIGNLYIDVDGFERCVPSVIQGFLHTLVFARCIEGTDALYQSMKWRGWPQAANEGDVLFFLENVCERLVSLARLETDEARLLQGLQLHASPNMPLAGTEARRKPDVCFFWPPGTGGHGDCSMYNDNASRGQPPRRWADVAIVGELKRNPSENTRYRAAIGLARYALQVFRAQPARRFVLGFTLCGSLTRLWLFDRLGGIAAPSFDLLKDGQKFVSTIMGFFTSDQQRLGVDPTIQRRDGRFVVTIFRHWYRLSPDVLAMVKRGLVIEEEFTKRLRSHFRERYQPLVPLVDELRRVVFPKKTRVAEDDAVYSEMIEVLSKGARELAGI